MISRQDLLFPLNREGFGLIRSLYTLEKTKTNPNKTNMVSAFSLQERKSLCNVSSFSWLASDLDHRLITTKSTRRAPRVAESLQKLNSDLNLGAWWPFYRKGNKSSACAAGTHIFGLASAKSGDSTSSSGLHLDLPSGIQLNSSLVPQRPSALMRLKPNYLEGR